VYHLHLALEISVLFYGLSSFILNNESFRVAVNLIAEQPHINEITNNRFSIKAIPSAARPCNIQFTQAGYGKVQEFISYCICL
jgi:hypothetical protein